MSPASTPIQRATVGAFALLLMVVGCTSADDPIATSATQTNQPAATETVAPTEPPAVATSTTAPQATATTAPQATATATVAPVATAEPAATPVGESPGLSAEEAQSQGVFTGPFDARLTLISGSRQEARFTLENVGGERDTYELKITPEDSTSTIEPATFDLDPGEVIELVMTDPQAGMRLEVHSEGRNGERIDAHRF